MDELIRSTVLTQNNDSFFLISLLLVSAPALPEENGLKQRLFEPLTKNMDVERRSRARNQELALAK